MFFNSNKWRRASYSIWALVYDYVVQIYHAQRCRSMELLSLKVGERVLIVGAGTGMDLDFMKRGTSVVAIDLTPAMLARLRRRAKRLGLEVDARVMDGQAMDFPDASFDAVILHLIVAVVPDPVRCLREVARVLRPGGRAVVLDKFAPEGTETPIALRILNPFASMFGTEITRKLHPLLATAGLEIVHEQSFGTGGLIKIASVRKRVLSPGPVAK